MSTNISVVGSFFGDFAKDAVLNAHSPAPIIGVVDLQAWDGVGLFIVVDRSGEGRLSPLPHDINKRGLSFLLHRG